LEISLVIEVQVFCRTSPRFYSRRNHPPAEFRGVFSVRSFFGSGADHLQILSATSSTRHRGTARSTPDCLRSSAHQEGTQRGGMDGLPAYSSKSSNEEMPCQSIVQDRQVDLYPSAESSLQRQLLYRAGRIRYNNEMQFSFISSSFYPTHTLLLPSTFSHFPQRIQLSFKSPHISQHIPLRSLSSRRANSLNTLPALYTQPTLSTRPTLILHSSESFEGARSAIDAASLAGDPAGTTATCSSWRWWRRCSAVSRR
jgi:hypothetical protein